MPWCPICKNEYREGIKLCAECQVELVEQLEDEKEQSAGLGEQEQIARLQAMFTEENEAPDAEEDSEVYAEEEPASYRTYRNSAVKAEDNRISAYMLFLVGILGFAGVILVFTGIIPLFPAGGTTRYFVCGVMGALFILFIVFGVVSMRDSKLLLVQAQSENSLLSEITKWCDENLSAERIDSGLFEGDMSEEQKYFKRTDRMKELINDKFMNLDQGLLEHFVDEYYQGLFEGE